MNGLAGIYEEANSRFSQIFEHALNLCLQ